MRILLLSEFYGDAAGGVETHVKGLKEYLESEGHELVIITPNRKKWDWLIGSHPLVRSFYYFLKAFPLASGCDLIYTVYTLSPMIAAIPLKFIFGKRLVSGIWNTEALEKIRSSRPLQFLVSQVDDVIFFTQAHKRLFKRGHVIPNWVDLRIFHPGRSEIRKRLRWEKDFVMVFVGRPSKGKGLHTLMHAMRNIDCKLLVVGSFVEDDHFKSLAGKLGLAEKVRFIGKVEHDKLPDYYRAGDVFCVPSTVFEGQGIVFIEAMACGLPIITTRIPAIDETVGKSAVLVDPEDVGQLASAIRKIKIGRKLRKQLSKAGLHKAAEYSKDRVLRAYLKVLLKNDDA